ncbi:hypothetical protein LSAT2_008702 [Lamellibrachia satsuma]|nr:hypothetical protein LSAT2_008702 [Lamellibrachia satsuma]
MLYQDEAARIWEKRESEWARERQARERLMQEVLGERQRQISEKMDMVRQQQEESLQRREELVQDLEMMQQMTRREQEEQDDLKTARKQELQAQISTRRNQKHGEQLRLNLDLLDDHKAEEEYEEMLRQEAEKMSVRGYTPKVHVKKQAWMLVGDISFIDTRDKR